MSREELAMKTKYLTVTLTLAEAQAAHMELETATRAAEENPGPHHPTHYAAKRVMKKLQAAILADGELVAKITKEELS